MKFITENNIDEVDDINKPNIELWDKNGNFLTEYAETEALVKKVSYTQLTKYFIKASYYKLAHPRANNLRAIDPRKHANNAFLYQWREVTKQCFDLYMKLLSTKKDYFYTQANMTIK